MDAFHQLEDLGEVAFDVRSRGMGLDYQTGFLEQFVRALNLAPHGDTGADRDRLDFGCSFHGPRAGDQEPRGEVLGSISSTYWPNRGSGGSR